MSYSRTPRRVADIERRLDAVEELCDMPETANSLRRALRKLPDLERPVKCPPLLGPWGNTMRDAVRNTESWQRAPCAYPRS